MSDYFDNANKVPFKSLAPQQRGRIVNLVCKGNNSNDAVLEVYNDLEKKWRKVLSKIVIVNCVYRVVRKNVPVPEATVTLNRDNNKVSFQNFKALESGTYKLVKV